MTPLAQKSLRILFLTLASILISALALAQSPTRRNPPCKTLSTKPEAGAIRKPTPCRAGLRVETSISLGAFAQLTTARSKDIPYNATIVQGTAPSAGVLGTFRQTFSPWLGYSVNLGYSRLSEHYRGYTVSTDSGQYVNGFNVSTNVYESSLTFLAHTRVNHHYSIFADAGPGILTFLPVHRGADAINYVPFQYESLVPGVQVRPAGVFGSGLDFRLTRFLSLRAEYRGLLYKNPDFETGAAPYSRLMTLTSEPTFSVVYNFTHPR